MTDTEHYHAIAAQSSAVPTLLCGRCRSTLSRGRIFRNGERHNFDINCDTVALCSADDCGALNCCDEALKGLEGAAELISKAS
ncbi:hypothetical protein [Marinobacter orientalis]|uniref:Uncharacterized protein n=1 Tax=Marinobacter orientalis TaxID=1928859 RepID=A0A7Y0RD62_9GAMM|nr:hypothetical protein [Marinobacter orientalis]NMT64054.1 hypothetical protein [Marinobacter orientalis]TGX49290.1 hypothetical protein DIT72_10655 [Marinobacter orientalis]